MTRFFSTLLFSTLILFSFNSCERIIETDIGDVENNLVMVSNFSDNNRLEVVVTSTRPVTSNSSEIDVITNAVVTVYEGIELIEELSLSMPTPGSNGLPTYISLDFRPKVGITYTIRATAPGFKPVHATNIIPKGVSVGDVGFINTLNLKNAEIADVNFNINLNFQDDPDESNYYHILFYQQLLGFRLEANLDGSFDTISVSNAERADIEFNLLSDDIPYVKFLGGQSMLIKDETFAGQDVNLAIEGNFSFNIQKHLPGTFSVEIRTVSEAYYLYYTTLVNQNQANNDVLAEPIPVFDNVTDGGGIFAGYSTNTTVFLINP